MVGKIDKNLFIAKLKASNPKMTEAQVTLLWNNYQTTGTLPKGFDSLLPSSDNKPTSGSVFGGGVSQNLSSTMTLERTTPQVQVEPKQAEQPKITDEQAQDLTIQHLSFNVQDAIQSCMSQYDKDGIVSKGWDGLKQVWNSKYSSTNVGKAIDGEMKGIDYMQKAQNGELTKREYYQDNKERLLNMFPGFSGMTQSQQLKMRAKVDSLSMQQIKDMQHEFAMTSPDEKAKLKERTQKFINEPLPQSGSVEIKSKFISKSPTPPNPMNSEEKISFEEVFKYERGCEFSKDKVEKLEEDKAKFSFVSGAYQKVEGFKKGANKVLKEYDDAILPKNTGEYSIPGTEPNADSYQQKVLDVFKGYYGKDSKVTQAHVQALLDENKFDVKALQDEKGNVSLKFGEKYKTDSDKNSVLNSLLNVETKQQEAKLKQVMGGNTYEDYQQKYAQSYVDAMGTKNSAELAKAFAEGQDGFNRAVSGVMTYGGMTMMVVGGVATLVPGLEPVGAGMLKVGGDLALAGMVTKTVLDVANSSTKKGGMTDEDAKDILKEAAINAGGFAIGFGAGAVGSKVGSALISNGVSRLPALVAERGVDATLSMLGDMAMMGDVNLQGNAMNAVIATVTGLSKSKQMFKGERKTAIEEGVRFNENKLEQTGVLKDSPSETVNPFAKETKVESQKVGTEAVQPKSSDKVVLEKIRNSDEQKVANHPSAELPSKNSMRLNNSRKIDIDQYKVPAGSVAVKSANVNEVLLTTGLNNCAGLAIYDKVANTQALIHSYKGTSSEDFKKGLLDLFPAESFKDVKRYEITVVPGAALDTEVTITKIQDVLHSMNPDIEVNFAHFPSGKNDVLGMQNGKLFATTQASRKGAAINPERRLRNFDDEANKLYDEAHNTNEVAESTTPPEVKKAEQMVKPPVKMPEMKEVLTIDSPEIEKIQLTTGEKMKSYIPGKDSYKMLQDKKLAFVCENNAKPAVQGEVNKALDYIMSRVQDEMEIGTDKGELVPYQSVTLADGTKIFRNSVENLQGTTTHAPQEIISIVTPDGKNTMLPINSSGNVFKTRELLALLSKVEGVKSFTKVDPKNFGLDLSVQEKFNIEKNVQNLHQNTQTLAPEVVKMFEEDCKGIDGVTTQDRIKDIDATHEKSYRRYSKAQKAIKELDKELKTATDPTRITEIKTEIAEKQQFKKDLGTNYSVLAESLGDVLGLRTIFSKPTAKNIETYVQRLIERINNGDCVVTELENYAVNKDGFYFSKSQADRIKEACKAKGIDMKYSEVFKDSGYTTTQLNITYKNGQRAEMQVRDLEVHNMCEDEHTLYDIREGKDIAKGNKEIEDLVAPVYDALKQLDADPDLKKVHDKYLQDCYLHKRELGQGKATTPPIIDSKLPQVLDMANIKKINDLIHSQK